MKKIYCWLLTISIFMICCFVFLNCGVTDAGERPVEPSLFEQKIMENENELKGMVEQIGGRFVTDNPFVQNLFYLFSNGKLPNGSSRDQLITCLEMVGVGHPNLEDFSGFIREPLIIELLVHALTDDERDVRRSAFNRLIRNTEWRLLSPLKSDIRQAIAVHRDIRDSLRLFALLNPTDSERQEWLGMAQTLTLRAALGNTQSEDSLITQFENVNTFRRLENLAFDLAFVGFNSQKSRIALVKGLETEILREYDLTEGSAVFESGIIPIIAALRRLHPNEPLLNNEFKNVEEPIYTATGIVNDPTVVDYLGRLASWARFNYGVTLDFPQETSFIRKIR